MKAEPTILGLLQNQWAKDSQRLDDLLRRRPEHRHALIRRLLAPSFTGRRLRHALGDWFDRIIWDNASPVITARACGCPHADADYLGSILRTVQPDIVLAFGKQARVALEGSTWSGVTIYGPHPAARMMHILARLHAVRRALVLACDALTNGAQFYKHQAYVVLPENVELRHLLEPQLVS